MRLPILAIVSAAALALPASAEASSAAIEGSTLHVLAAPGEQNEISIAPADTSSRPATLTVTDSGPGVTLTSDGTCESDPTTGAASCPTAGLTRIVVDAGDGNDRATVDGPLPARISGGDGDDALTDGPAGGVLSGGAGDDTLRGGRGSDRLDGGDGADDLHGGSGNDRLTGGRGHDSFDGGSGDDRIDSRDGTAETAVSCGSGFDRARVDVSDQLDPYACESVDYGPAGGVGPIRRITGGGRFVTIPGQGGAKIDRRLLPDVLFLIRRYHVHIVAGFSTSSVHAAGGEHPLGLATDIVPGPGGSWNDVDRLARWAEPRQNYPRLPFRWVGYNGDYNHGRGNHLHLSWSHSAGTFGKPVKTVWVFDVSAGASASSARGTSGGLGPARHMPPERER